MVELSTSQLELFVTKYRSYEMSFFCLHPFYVQLVIRRENPILKDLFKEELEKLIIKMALTRKLFSQGHVWSKRLLSTTWYVRVRHIYPFLNILQQYFPNHDIC